MNTPAITHLSTGSAFGLTVSDNTVRTNEADVRSHRIARDTLIVTKREFAYETTHSNRPREGF